MGIVTRPWTAGKQAFDGHEASQRLIAPGVGRRGILLRLCHGRFFTHRAQPACAAAQERRQLPQLRAQ